MKFIPYLRWKGSLTNFLGNNAHDIHGSLIVEEKLKCTFSSLSFLACSDTISALKGTD